jgi:hypothetical protein
MYAVMTERSCQATYMRRASAVRFVEKWQPALNDKLVIIYVFPDDIPAKLAARAGLSPDSPAVHTACRRARLGRTGRRSSR